MSSNKLTAAQEKRIRSALEKVPFANLLGIELDSFAPGTAIVALTLRREHLQNNGVVHGGVIASLIDTATAFAVLTVVPKEERVTTVDLTITYLRSLVEGRVRARAEVLRTGRRVIAVSAEVLTEDETLAATALSTYLRLGV
ncbi:MAG: ABC transporter substrate-binding protein [Acidobacteria bacterium]|nr:MAG: ABC transporter substrate-binding protein [Acidobacteriota bacterium]